MNRDGSVTISDVTVLINKLLSHAEYDELADCNQDGSIAIQDVTVLINYLLSKHW